MGRMAVSELGLFTLDTEIPQLIQQIQAGRRVVLVDSSTRIPPRGQLVGGKCRG